MKAAFFREHGGADRVEFGDLPEPAAGPGQVRVRVKAAAAKGGRLLTCGATTGPDPQTDLGRIFWNQLTVYGSTMGTHAEFAGMLKLFSDGKVKPVVDAVFPLSSAGEALRRLEEKRQFGKIVLRVD